MLILVGGIVPKEDREKLREMDVVEIFGLRASMVSSIEAWD